MNGEEEEPSQSQYSTPSKKLNFNYKSQPLNFQSINNLQQNTNPQVNSNLHANLQPNLQNIQSNLQSNLQPQVLTKEFYFNFAIEGLKMIT